MAEVYVTLDVETTGLDTWRDEIIEVGLCRIENDGISARFQSFVRPNGPVPLRVRNLTGIDDDLLRDAPAWKEIEAAVASFIGDATVVGHHVAFDTGFLSRYLGKTLPNRLVDTCDLARLLLPEAKGYSLAYVAELLGVPYPVQHRALFDAEATAEVFRALLARIRELSPQVLSTVGFLLERGGSVLASFFKEALRETKAIPTRILSPGTFPGAPEQDVEDRQVIPDALATLDFFRPGGRLARILPAYEYRAQQEEMAAAVDDALRNNTCLVVEAGTGIGKSLAYLIPLVMKAIRSKKRVLISTHTVNLQEQLLLNDVPMVKAALGIDFSAVLVKGRQHYLCLRRWERLLEEVQRSTEGEDSSYCKSGSWEGEFHAQGKGTRLSELNDGGAATGFYARMAVWLAGTVTGDFGDLSLTEGEREALAKVAATAEGCLGKSCSFAGRCFVNNARRKAEEATVLITNHALMLTDALTGGSVLPDYDSLVVDEAHHLEDVATEALTRSATEQAITRWLSRLFPLLLRARGVMRYLNAGPVLEKKVNAAAEEAKHAAKKLFSVLEELLGEGDPASNGFPAARRLRDSRTHLVMDTPVRSWYVVLVEKLGVLLRACRELTEEAKGWERTWVQEITLWIKEGQEILDTLVWIVENDDPHWVRWVEGKVYAGAMRAVLKAAPVSVQESLHAALFSHDRGMILTSATITVAGSFEHFTKRIGLDRLRPENVAFKTIGSPFAYEERASLCVVSDLPLLQEVPADEYFASISDALAEITLAVQERVLVLFTANRMMREVVLRLRPRLEAEKVVVLAQGIDGGRTRLLEEFKRTPYAVLCGTASFWEGIDISGGVLRLIVIVKLPFPPYEVPVMAARRARLAEMGEDDFRGLSLPHAVLRFKQGFGRLIRSHRDKGVVVVLDRRLVNKSYGPTFIKSLPPVLAVSLPLAEACTWLRERLRYSP